VVKSKFVSGQGIKQGAVVAWWDRRSTHSSGLIEPRPTAAQPSSNFPLTIDIG